MSYVSDKILDRIYDPVFFLLHTGGENSCVSKGKQYTTNQRL